MPTLKYQDTTQDHEVASHLQGECGERDAHEFGSEPEGGEYLGRIVAGDSNRRWTFSQHASWMLSRCWDDDC